MTPEVIPSLQVTPTFSFDIEPTDAKFIEVPRGALEIRGILPEYLKELSDNLGDGSFIAGGHLTALIAGYKPSDVDVFFKSSEDFLRGLKYMQTRSDYQIELPKNKAVEEVLRNSEVRFINFKPVRGKAGPVVQLMKFRFFKDINSVLDAFDFTLVQLGIDNGKKTFVSGSTSALDIARKRVVVHRITFPAATLRRLIKYTQKGFYACGGALNEIVLGVRDLKDEELEQRTFLYLD